MFIYFGIKKWFETLGILDKFEKYLKYNKWLSTLDIHDRFGPNKAAESIGIDINQYFALASPIELALIKKFSEKEKITQSDLQFDILKVIGESIVTSVGEFMQYIKTTPIEYKKNDMLVLLQFNCKSNPVVQEIIEEKDPPFVVVVGGRGDTQLWIRDKSINIDLSAATFVHPNGTIAGFKNIDDLKKAIGLN